MKIDNKKVTYNSNGHTFNTQRELAQHLELKYINVKRMFAHRGGVRRIVADGGSFISKGFLISIDLI